MSESTQQDLPVPVVLSEDPRLGLPSASSTEREVNCPGWRALVREILASGQKLPTESELAAQGTRIHAAFESGSDEGLEEDEKTIATNLNNMAEEALEAWTKTLPSDFRDRPPIQLREARLWARRRDNLARFWSAQVDRAYIIAPYALVIDAKTGFKDAVASERNWQIRTQVLTLWHEYPNLTDIRGGIAASRLRNKLDLSDYKLGDLRAIESTLLTASWRSSQPDAPRHAGSWCDYCPAKAWCREATTRLSLIRSEMSGLTPAAIKERVSMMRPTALAAVYKERGTVEKIMEAVKERLKGMPEDELATLGFKLQPGAKRRTIKDVIDARDKLVKVERLVTEEEYMLACKPAFKAIYDFVAKRNPSLKKEQIEKVIKDALGTTLEENQNDPSLKEL